MPLATVHQDPLRALLKRQKIATLDELKQGIATTSTMTVFRRLKQSGYRTSYSHRGKYYTLAELPQFDSEGLWSCRSVWFSRYGNLLQTARAFVEQALAGLTAGELQTVLHVEVKQALLQLVRRKQIHREKIGSRYVYLAGERGLGKSQKLRRQEQQGVWEMGVSGSRFSCSQ